MASQRKELQRAVGYVRSLCIAVERRRPHGFSNPDADNVLGWLRAARTLLENSDALYEARQGDLAFAPPKPIKEVQP